MTGEELMLELTRHCDDLQRFAVGVEADAVAILEEEQSKIYALIFNLKREIGEGRLPNDYRTQQLLKDAERQLTELWDNVLNDLEDLLEEHAQGVAETQSEFWVLFLAGAGLTISGITKSEINNIVRYGKYRGLTRNQLLENVAQGDVSRVYQAIASGLQNGLSMEDICRNAEKEFVKTRRYLTTEVGTIINGLADDSALAVASRNKLRLLYLTMFDDKVCGDCMQYGGMIFDADDPALPAVPRHPNCRCVLVPMADRYATTPQVGFEDYFDTLDAMDQVERLGAIRYNAWDLGEYVLKPWEEPSRNARLSLADISRRDHERLA